MKWRKTTKADPRLKSSSYFDKLVNDTLRLILDQIYDENAKDLLSLCLVSRKLYIFSIPYLYRSIKLNFTRASSIRLLHQLTRPGSRLPEKVRNLGILSTDKDSYIRLSDLYVLFARLTCLQELHWEGSLSVPHFILETLSNRFPQAHFTIEASDLKLGVASNAPQSLYTVLNHPAAGQLTKFDFEPHDFEQLYNNFKQDLLKMLKCNRALRYLRVHEDLGFTREYPEMLSQFQSGQLPKPTELMLTTHIFTCQELSLWGAKGGWDRLSFLKLHDPQHLCEFIGKTPKLNELLFYTTNRFDIDEVAAHLGSVSVDTPFGEMFRLSYKDTDNWNSPVQDRRVVPWCILESLPTIKELDIHRSRFDYFLPGPYLDTATAEDIRKIRKLCPSLRKLNLDVALKGRKAIWPCDVLEELAQFTEPIELNLYLHLEDTRLARATIHRLTCRKMFKFILETRKSLGLTCQRPFLVGFKVVRLFEQIHDHWNITDYDFWIQDSERISMYRYKHWMPSESLDEMSIDDLRQRRLKQKLSRRLGWDRNGYEKEMHRRERGTGEQTTFPAHSTLYDLWA